MSEVDLQELEKLARAGDEEALYQLHREWDKRGMEIIHLTEKCPTCTKPALLKERCRCARYCIKCSEDHRWHTCAVHKVLVVGVPDHFCSGCTCKDAI